MLAATAETARRVSQLGLGIAGLGGLAIAWAGAIMLSRTQNNRLRGWLTTAAGLLLGVGFAIEILGIHLAGQVTH